MGMSDPSDVVQSLLDDVVWFCVREAAWLEDPLDADLQTLLGMLGGIAADGALCDEEIQTLRAWMSENEHLASVWPYDEIRALLAAALKDGVVDPDERAELLRYFAEFARTREHRAIGAVEASLSGTTVGLCAVQPTITFDGATFCFTGSFKRHGRQALRSAVASLGGSCVEHVSHSLGYLVVGADGSPCWAHACYGRKVELAVRLRRDGARLVMVHEHDFLDAMMDEGVDL